MSPGRCCRFSDQFFHVLQLVASPFVRDATRIEACEVADIRVESHTALPYKLSNRRGTNSEGDAHSPHQPKSNICYKGGHIGSTYRIRTRGLLGFIYIYIHV